MKKIKRGELSVIGNRIYGICETCGKLVRVNKPIFGSVHVCRSDEEIKKYGRWGKIQGGG